MMQKAIQRLGLALIVLATCLALLIGVGQAAEAPKEIQHEKPATLAAFLCELAGIGCPTIDVYEEEDECATDCDPPPPPTCPNFHCRGGILD